MDDSYFRDLAPFVTMSWGTESMCRQMLVLQQDVMREDIDIEQDRIAAGEDVDEVGEDDMMVEFMDFLLIAVRRELLSCISFILDEVPEVLLPHEPEEESLATDLLHTAIHADATKSMALLLEDKLILQDIDCCGSNDNPPLGNAILHKRYSFVESLLRHGASYDFWISWRQHPRDPNLRFHRGNILSYAVRMGDMKMVDLLIDNGLSPDGLIENEMHDCPLVQALTRNQVEMAKLLIFRGAVISSFGHPTVDLPLNAAIRECSTGTVLMLLDARANYNVTDMMGIDGLFSAIMYSRAEVISILLDRGAHIEKAHLEAIVTNAELALSTENSGKNGTEDPRRSLYISCMLGQERAIEIFLKHGFDINFSLSERFKSPLGAAVRYKRAGSAKMLLKAGADASLVDSGKLKALIGDGNC